MERKIKVIQYGVGKMAHYTVRYLLEKGCELVCAVDINPNITGKDVGEVLNLGHLGINVTGIDDVDSLFSSVNADACIITTMSLMSDLESAMLTCAKHGVNAISTCEEAFYPMNSSPKITDKIDDLAWENNCTICGAGYQDVFWGNLIATLAGATHKITKIVGRSSYNVEDYGIALAKVHGAGLDLDTFQKEIAASDNITPEERQKLIDEGKFLPSYMWNVNGWLCSKLGLTVTSQVQKCVPQTHNKDLTSSTLNMTIPAGYATGMSAVVTTETAEGITIESECIGKVYSEEEYDVNDWTIYGEPDTEVVIRRPATVELTCATIVNRLPDIINAPAGYVTTDNMPTNTYRVEPLNYYVE